jgi:hypothetical protein
MTELKFDPSKDYRNRGPFPLFYERHRDGTFESRLLDEEKAGLDPSGFGPCRRTRGYRHRRPYSGTCPRGPDRQLVSFESLIKLTCLIELDRVCGTSSSATRCSTGRYAAPRPAVPVRLLLPSA